MAEMSYKKQRVRDDRIQYRRDREQARQNINQAVQFGAAMAGFRTNGATIGPAGKAYAPKPQGVK